MRLKKNVKIFVAVGLLFVGPGSSVLAIGSAMKSFIAACACAAFTGGTFGLNARGETLSAEIQAEMEKLVVAKTDEEVAAIHEKISVLRTQLHSCRLAGKLTFWGALGTGLYAGATGLQAFDVFPVGEGDTTKYEGYQIGNSVLVLKCSRENKESDLFILKREGRDIHYNYLSVQNDDELDMSGINDTVRELCTLDLEKTGENSFRKMSSGAAKKVFEDIGWRGGRRAVPDQFFNEINFNTVAPVFENNIHTGRKIRRATDVSVDEIGNKLGPLREAKDGGNRVSGIEVKLLAPSEGRGAEWDLLYAEHPEKDDGD